MNSTPIKILLVEDNPGDADLFQEILAEVTSPQFKLHHVESLGAGLQLLAQTHFDLVLLDLSLPDSQGLETLAKMRPHISAVPIIVLTGLDDEGLAVKAVQTGAQDYLVKGLLESSLLVRAIRYAIERHRLRIDLEQRTTALLQSEVRFHNMIEHNADGIVIFDARGLVRFVNPAAEALFDRPSEELLDKPFDFSAAMEERREFDVIRPTGEKISIEMRAVQTMWEGEEVYLASLRDITQRVKAEEALRESEEKYRALFENAPIGLGVADLEGNILTFNKTILEPGGYMPEDIAKLGNVAQFYCDPDDKDKVFEIFRTEGVLRQYETRLKRKDGTCYDAILSLTPTTMEGKPCMQAMVEDITEHKQLEEQFHQAQKMEAIGQLTGGIAHDFNNLLTAINGFAELLKMHLAPDDPLQEMADRILGPGQRAADLVRQLLSFSRKQVVEPKVMDVNEAVANMDKMLGRIIGDDIQVQAHLSPKPWLVNIDPTQIEQIILNLAVNARDAMPEGGQLTIETANVVLDDDYTASHLETQPGEYVLLAVSDTGLGISKEVQARIFEPFFTTKEKGQGTGLGLATVYGIVKQNGGNIWLYSEEGQGTSFKIYLPRAKEVTPASSRPDSQQEILTGTETILMVEDDTGVRDLIRRVLQTQGYTLLEAQDAQEALHLSSRYSGAIHLVLTDVVMPEMNGRALAERLHQTHPDSKILFMSGYTDNAIAHHGVLDQSTAFLQKPFSPIALSQKVRQVLDES